MHNFLLSASARGTRARMAAKATLSVALRRFPLWCAAAVVLVGLLTPTIAMADEWSFSTVEGNHGYNQSSMCGNGGSGVEAAYYDLSTTSLHHASKLDKTQGWVAETLPGSGNYGSWPSIARGADGRLHIAYYEVTIGSATLKYICRGTNGTWSTPVTVAFVGVCQGNCSLVLNRVGMPMIAFNTGNGGNPVRVLKIYKQQPDLTWAQFGNTISSAVSPHHITMVADANNEKFWVIFIDQSGARLNVWIYNGVQWLAFPATFAPGPYADASLALDPYQYPQLAYAAAGSLMFQPWAQEGDGFAPPVTVDASLGNITGVSMKYGWMYPRIGYVGNGIVKLATGIYSETEWPCAWTTSVVDPSGNMDAQVSLVMTYPDNKWLLYRNVTTNGMRSACPYWVDTTPPAPSPYLIAQGGCHSIRVLWQATGDDGNVGSATAYDLRWASSPMTTDAAFYGIGQVIPTAPPGPPGTDESILIEVGKCSSRRYFALKTGDDAGNWSTLVSDPYGARTACPRPPIQCEDEFDPVIAKTPPLPTQLIALRPNPTFASVDVDFGLARSDEKARLDLSVYDVAGRRVATLRSENPGVGLHTVRWDLSGTAGRRVSAGIYFVRLRVGPQTMVQKMVVLR